MSDIPDEAVDAGVKAIKAVEEGGFGWPGYDEERVREAIQAAAPIIRQQALAEAKARVEAMRNSATASYERAIRRELIDDILAALEVEE